MLTESWPLDFDPTLPLTWAPTNDSKPLVAYLDTWCYQRLAKDRAGTPGTATEAGCYEYFRQLALDGKVVFPLSQAHYQETWKYGNQDQRWDQAVVMAELSGFNTITSVGVETWDALIAVAAFVGSGIATESPRVLGWGFQHCLTGKAGSASVIDRRTGRPAQWDHVPEDQRTQMYEIERQVAERFEFAMLARRDPRLEPDLAPFAKVPDNGKGQRLIDDELKLRAAIDQHGRDESTVRAFVESQCFASPVNFKSIVAACSVLGVAPEVVLDEFDSHATVKQNRRAMSKFIALMPMQGRYAELRVQAHMQPNRGLKASDGLDYYAIASISPFVDYLVADQGMSNLAETAKLGQRHGATVLPKLNDLRACLSRDLSPAP